VCPAAELDIVYGRFPTGCIRIDVMELQEAALDTSAVVVCDEGALAGVSLPDLPLDLSRDVTRARVCTAAAAGAVGRGDLLFL
jgi:hypothetical protein